MESKSEMNIEINHIEIGNDERGVLMVGFFELKDDFEKGILFQFQEKLSDQDLKFGWSKYYMGFADGSSGNYNCLKEIKLSTNSCVFYLSESGNSIFGVDSIVLNLSAVDQNQAFEIIKNRFCLEDVEVSC